MSEGSRLLIHLSTLLWVLGSLGFLVFSVWLSIVDLATRRLPNRLVGWGAASTLAPLAASGAVLLPTALRGSALEDLALMLGGALGLFALFALLWRFARGGIGGGDAKVAPLVGGALGFFGGVWAIVAAAVLACLIAAVWGFAARRSGRAERGVPFAPCLFGGAWLAIAAFPVVARLSAGG